MILARIKKEKRQEQLRRELEENPFLTDEELTHIFTVSIQTIRLDRLELGIPEYRERIKTVAQKHFDTVRSLPIEEVFGEVIDLELDKSAISLLEIGADHVFSRNHIARGHVIFAQANSLAVAVLNEEVVLTATANVKYIRPVYLGERSIAKARVLNSTSKYSEVEVVTYVEGEAVFEGRFTMYRSQHWNKSHNSDGGRS